MSGHTPGPWESSEYVGAPFYDGERGWRVCTVARAGRPDTLPIAIVGGDNAVWLDEGAAEANAALIASAPDLLELAEQSVEDRTDLVAPEDAEVLALCERVGFGAVIDSVARQWRMRDGLGARTIGHCVVTVERVLAKAHGVAATKVGR